MENEKKDISHEDIPENEQSPVIDGTIEDIPADLDAESDNTSEEVEFIPIDALLYDSEEIGEVADYADSDGFDAFFAEYRQLMASTLDAARKKSEEEENSDEDANDIPAEQSVLISSATDEAKAEKTKKKKEKKEKKADSDEEWSGDITLEPEVYESLEEESEIFVDEPVVEEEVDLIGEAVNEPEFIDSEDEEGDIQISFFADEKKPKDIIREDEKDKKYDPENPRRIDGVFDFLELFVFTLVAVMLLTTFFFKHSVVEGDSMNQTLTDGDHLIIWDAFYTPERYDIVVFEDYSIEDQKLKKPIIKRIIGLPGETVEINQADDGKLIIYVDGVQIEDEYGYYLSSNVYLDETKWTLAEDEIFVLGDNRCNSTDSRTESVGPISTNTILGKVVLRFYPFASFTTFD